MSSPHRESSPSQQFQSPSTPPHSTQSKAQHTVQNTSDPSSPSTPSKRQSRSRSRRRSRHRSSQFQGQQHQPVPPLPAFPLVPNPLATVSQPLAYATQALPPLSDSSSSTVSLPSGPSTAEIQALIAQHQAAQLRAAAPSANPNTADNPISASQLQPSGRLHAPPYEHPVQVPVRVVNSDEPGSGGDQKGNLRLRLDLNLEVEVTLKAKIRGDLTLALL